MKNYNNYLLVSFKNFYAQVNTCSEYVCFFPIELVLKQEQEEYQREGIAWKNIEYFNNKVSCHYNK